MGRPEPGKTTGPDATREPAKETSVNPTRETFVNTTKELAVNPTREPDVNHTREPAINPTREPGINSIRKPTGEPEIPDTTYSRPGGGADTGPDNFRDLRLSRDLSLGRNQTSSLFANSSLNQPLRETSLTSTLTRDRSKDPSVTREHNKEPALTRDNPFRDAILGLGRHVLNIKHTYIIL